LLTPQIHLGGHELTLKPLTHAKYEIKIDGQDLSLDPQETYYFPTNQKLLRTGSATQDAATPPNYKFKIYRWDRQYTIESFMNVVVYYDGNSVKVVAPAHVKGQHCGMCGDFNGDTEGELVHPQMCQLTSGTEMANAWVRDNNDSICPRRPDCKYSEKLLYTRQTK
jgi:5-methylcytosine-specific restriction endonuclease McrA